MGLQSSLIRYRKRAVAGVAPSVLPYFGVAALVPNAQKTSAFILALPQRGPTATRVTPEAWMDSSTMSLTMYYAYPMSYGQAVFTDITPAGGSFMQGGWDGAHGDSGNTLGPVIVPVNVGGTMVDFYLYQTDYPNNGLMLWKVD